MVGYVRKSVADILNGLPITAPPLNAEFNALELAFDQQLGHGHTGAGGDAPKIDLQTAVVGFLPVSNGGAGGKNNTTASAVPTNLNDYTEGYAPGSYWFIPASDRLFVCVDNSSGAAIWHEFVKRNEQNIIAPATHNAVDLGMSATRYRDAYLGGDLDVSGGVTVAGQIDALGGVSGAVTGDVTGNVSGNVTSTGVSTFADVTINGTLDMTAGSIRNVAAPTMDADAATKLYVDQVVAQTIDAAPGTLDTLNELAAALGDDPNFATTVSNDIATKLPKAGGTMTGNIAMSGYTVTGLRTPTQTADAVTLGYLNSRIEPLSTALYYSDIAEQWAVNPEDVAVNGNFYSALHYAAKAAASEADAETSAANASQSETKAADWANEAEDVTVETGLYSARHHALKAAQSATNAASSSTSAATSESNAATSEANAATSEANAAASEGNAATSATNAAASASNASSSASAASTSAGQAAADATKAETSKNAAVDASVDSFNAQTAAEAARDETVASSDALAYARAIAAGNANIILNPSGEVVQEGVDFRIDGAYPVDMWQISSVGISGSGVQSSYHGNGTSFRIKSNENKPNLAASDRLHIQQNIERHRLTPLTLGFNNAKPSHVAFLAYAGKAGTYTFSIRSGQFNRTFLAPFTIPTVAEWFFFSIEVPPDFSGTWDNGGANSRGATVSFCGASGSNHVGVAGWQDGSYLAVPEQTNLAAVAQDNLHISHVVWAPGTALLTAETIHAAMRSYDEELRDCQRYFWRGKATDGQGSGNRYSNGANGLLAGPATKFNVPMRTVPAISFSGGIYSNCSHHSIYATEEGFTERLQTSSSTTYRALDVTYTANARL